jgi:ribonucleoside-triphosphate reductase
MLENRNAGGKMAAPKSGVRVVKTSGDFEYFDPNVITEECVEAGIEFFTAAEVALEVSRRIYDGISTREIQDSTLKVLYKKHPEAAERYKRFHSMLVRTSRNTIEPFDRKKITASLLKETRLPRELAEIIARESEVELRRLKLDFISAPLVREVVNVKLLEHGFEESRADYTRLGMPVYDATALIEAKNRDASSTDPELLHFRMADSIFKEYTLLKVLPLHLADGHMRGQIHIHDLDYFVSRPYAVEHDLRWFLEKGLELGLGERVITTGPADNPRLAFLQAAKVLYACQSNVSRRQVLKHFNVFLAPYIKGLDFEEVKELLRLFVMESQIHTLGDIEVQVEYACPESLKQVYGDFEAEIKTLAKALTEVYAKGDPLGRAISIPAPRYTARKEDFQKEGFLEFCALAHEAAYKFETPVFSSVPGTLKTASTLGVITINLPRAAYEAEGDDNKLLEMLDDRLEMARDVLMIKREVIDQRLKQGLLPFLNQHSDGRPYYSPDDAVHAIGYIGINEMVKAHTGEAIHESRFALNFGVKVLRKMANKAKEWSTTTGLKWALTLSPSNETAFRLAKLDYGEFAGKAVVDFNEEGRSRYTRSSIRQGANIPLMERLKIESTFHSLVSGETPLEVSAEGFTSGRELMELSRKISKLTGIKTWKFSGTR